MKYHRTNWIVYQDIDKNTIDFAALIFSLTHKKKTWESLTKVEQKPYRIIAKKLIKELSIVQRKRINWVQSNTEFLQFQMLSKYIKKKNKNWSFQQCFTTWFQLLCTKNGVAYYQQHEQNFLQSNSIIPQTCEHCGKLFQRKLPGKDLKALIYQTTCDTCLRQILTEANLWTKDHEKKYQIIMKGTSKNAI